MVMCAVLAVIGIVGAIIFGNLSYSQPANGILQGMQHAVEQLMSYLCLGCLVVVISALIAYCWIAYQLYRFTNE
jgi:predicted histidine transporter YuiF (NhaC family)